MTASSHPLLASLPDLRESGRFIRSVDTGEVRVLEADGQHALELAPHTPTTYERFVKPVIDRVGAVVLLLLLAPLLAAVALVVRITMGPGVIYRQARVGRGGEVFTICKFRTMQADRRRDRRGVPNGKPERRRTHKTEADPRHTRVGRFLRRTSLDELPQLWNVVRGDMSLVGPRPELTEIVDQYATWQHRRHDVKPGITGVWQVSERDTEGRMHLHVATDLVYVRNVSLATDLRLLLLTVPSLFGTYVSRRAD